jgi:predicted anti-sigma-YlaC factor YlaD
MIQSNHITLEQFEAYRNCTLSPSELLAVGNHLAKCEVCRGQFAGATKRNTAAFLFESLFQTEHLTDDQIDAEAEGTTSALELADLRYHLEHCSICSQRLLALKTFITEFEEAEGSINTPERERMTRLRAFPTFRQLSLTPRLITLPALALLAIVCLFVFRIELENANMTSSARIPTRQLVGRALSNLGEPQSGNAPNVEDACNLNGHDYGLDSSGNVVYDGSILPVPSSPWDLHLGLEDQSVVRGGAGKGPRLLYPVHTVVDSLRPQFAWRPVNGAIAYAVEIYSSAGLISVSGPLTAAVWQPSESLPADHLLAWRVTAFMNSGDLRASPATKGSAEAFRTLSISSYDSLADVKKKYPNVPLAIGFVYFRDGLYPHAEIAVGSYLSQHPKDVRARDLLQRIREAIATN